MAAIKPEKLLDQALDALKLDRGPRQEALDALPAPVYLTDPHGEVTFWNRACVEFAGREPQLGQDRWCVTWKIHTTEDQLLPHDQCPMAVAIKERREVRGEIAIAMRPDGSRRAFVPYPTPLFDRDGNMTGAINLLIDVSEEQSSSLAAQADHCRRLAKAMCDKATAAILTSMADGYARNAIALGHKV